MKISKDALWLNREYKEMSSLLFVHHSDILCKSDLTPKKAWRKRISLLQKITVEEHRLRFKDILQCAYWENNYDDPLNYDDALRSALAKTPWIKKCDYLDRRSVGRHLLRKKATISERHALTKKTRMKKTRSIEKTILPSSIGKTSPTTETMVRWSW